MDNALTFDWTPAKSDRNVAERGLSFEAARGFDFATARIRLDERSAYGEDRFVATGFVGERLHVLVWTPRPPVDVWVISFRKANRREVRRYERFIEDQS